MVPTILDFFTDSVLRAPTMGSMLMCLASSLIGVLAFVQRRSLLGEALSHAAYPGVVLGVLCAAFAFPSSDEMLAGFILMGAFISSLIGLFIITRLEKRLRVPNDAALCFVLSAFFGTGILLASRIQFTHALWYKQIQVFLFGQAATMTDLHVMIYALLTCLIAVVLFAFYRVIQTVSFDKPFAQSIGVHVDFFETIIFFLLVLSVVVGMRSVGVVLMSGMLIAPAVAARQWTHKLSYLLMLAGIVGLVSGFLGNYLSIALPVWVDTEQMALPTGPMILLSASSFACLSLLFAPNTGWLSRTLRIVAFRYRRHQENVLKAFWKKGPHQSLSFEEVASWEAIPYPLMRLLLHRLIAQGWVVRTRKNHYQLTNDGQRRAAHVVRLHRLWEVYLVDYLGQQAGKVHRSAEEMEHILSPELEAELSTLLNDPKRDPHNQPIPQPKDIL